MRTRNSDNESDYEELTPPPRRIPTAQRNRPPPPPPPPPPHLPHPAPPQPSEWVLTVRVPRIRSLRKIQVSRNMSVEAFSDCLRQALALSPELYAGALAGLWREETETFLSLHDILRTPAELQHNLTHALYIEVPPPPAPWWKPYVYIVTHFLIPTILGCTLLYHIETIMELFSSTVMTVLDTLIEAPLTSLHRYGPRWLGFWEGEHLSSICARITYHGDPSFWRRHLEECEGIYTTKLHAFLQVARPLTYTLLLMGTLYTVVLSLRHARQKVPERNDDAIHLYHAFRTIAQQFHQRGR